MNYLEAQEHVQSFTIDLPAATQDLIPEWINLAVQEAESRHNFKYMQALASFNTTAATHVLGDIPERWKEKRADPYLIFEDGTTSEISWAPSDSEMIRQFSDATDDIGEPAFILEVPESVEFNVYPFSDTLADWTAAPAGEYRVRLPYWRYSAALVDDTESNAMLVAPFGFYVVHWATSRARLFNEDETGAQKYIALAERDFTNAVGVDKRSKSARRTTLVPRKEVYGKALTRRRM